MCIVIYTAQYTPIVSYHVCIKTAAPKLYSVAWQHISIKS